MNVKNSTIASNNWTLSAVAARKKFDGGVSGQSTTSTSSKFDAVSRRDSMALGSNGLSLLLVGLVTFSDGSNGLPRQEGTFECGKLISPCECSMQVSKAQEAAAAARQM